MRDYPSRIEVINATMKCLYGAGSSAGGIIALADVVESVSQFERSRIVRVIDDLVKNDIVDWEQKDQILKINGNGKVLYARDCVPEVVLGLPFCAWKYERAVVHVIVPGTDQDEAAGTGFFLDEPPGCLITNLHVVERGRVLRIIDNKGDQICGETREITLHPNDQDLALVRCTTPPACLPLRIDWEEHDAVFPLDEVLILGYPKIPMHLPTLMPSQAQVCAYAKQFSRDDRKSLILTKVGGPGSSGGPVINSKGFVIGVVSAEPTAATQDGTVGTLLAAVPALYINDLLGGPLAEIR